MKIAPYSVQEIKDKIISKMRDTYGIGLDEADNVKKYNVLAQIVREEVMQRLAASRGTRKAQRARKLYYLSAEFLVGRALHNNMVNLVNEKNYFAALKELGIDRDAIFEIEPEPGLGNGGLGRLAACFLDSLTSLDLPAMGCSIRYELGFFRQNIENGFQVEVPDSWLDDGNIWEMPQMDQVERIQFGGRVEEYTVNGKKKFNIVGATTVEAVPYDIPCVGYDTTMVNMLRVWSARSPKRIDMQSFNAGQYVQSMAEKSLAEVISKVLYPNDDSEEGKRLRLNQQYFFSAATVRYAVKDFIAVHGKNWDIFPDKVAFHINDTHPAIAIPELMRLLMDEYELSWEQAEHITRNSFTYTNHTVMPEALEKWTESLIREQFPRIYMILEEMNRRTCERLWEYYPGQWERIGRMAIIGYGFVHMANLSVAYSRMINGVSAIHTDILKKQTFRDYYVATPGRFVNVTNGITHRRWLIQCNSDLADLIDEAIGDKWRKEPSLLRDLKPFADDAVFRKKFAAIKRGNKERLADRVLRHQGINIDPDTIFDTQAKRLHEYKRQLMNALKILVLYNRIDANPSFEMPPVTFLFAAKASPAYARAKLIIKLINSIGDLVAKHPRASRMIKVVFIQNYNVSAAEYIMPATDISEQISTAGKEASGTGNMKFMMNGAVTLGTMDGANCEIYDQVGENNIYIFGLTADQVESGYSTYRATEIFETDNEIRHAMEQLIDGTLEPQNPRIFADIYHALLFGDYGGMADPYFVLKDLRDYISASMRVFNDYTDRDKWFRMAVTNTTMSGIFSTDRTIREYNELIWHLRPIMLEK